MKASRSILAGVVVATAAFSAFAKTAYAADEGLPPNIAALQAADRVAPPVAQADQYVPHVLIVPGGEITQVPNPVFRPAQVERASAHVIRTQSYPATHYVGA
jgi:hypothetical protein